MAVNGIEEMNGEIFSDDLGELEDEGGSLEPAEDQDKDQECQICNQKLCDPRVLSCLHVFCEPCLEKLLMNEAGDSLKFDCVIVCPTCMQETKVSSGGVSRLPSDYILINILDVSTVDHSVVCTCCKSKEQAVARCSDCSHFLCPNCKTAHEFMRCFENHKVIPFEAIKNSKENGTIHKPVFCDLHTGESLVYYCHTCQEAICQECMVRSHKGLPGHRCERVDEAEDGLRAQLMELTQAAAVRAAECQLANRRLNEALADLQRQRDEAQGLIRETYQSYRAILEAACDDALQTLERLHSERELKVMDLFENLDKSATKMEDAGKFTARLLQFGDATEIALLKKVIGTQMIHLIKTSPKPDIDYSVQFETNFEKFESMIQENFGKFKTESSKDSPDSGTGTSSATVLSMSASSPAPMMGSMQSSFDDYSLAPSSPLVSSPLVAPGIPPVLPPALPPLSSIVEYNLQQLASLAEEVPPSHPTHMPSPSPPSFTLADILNGDLTTTTHALNNLQALAKLGLNTDVNGVGGVGGVGDGRSPPLLALAATPSPRSSTAEEAPSGFPRQAKPAHMHIRFKFGQLGSNKGQFNSPHGFCLGNEEDIIVADTNNHRITVFEKTGTYKFHFGTAGKEEGQLWYPRKVAVMKSTGKFVVCDRGNERSRMQIFTKNGHFLKKIAVRYIDIVAGLAVTQQGHIVAVDSVTPTVFVISENGDLIRWFDCSECMREPSDIAINGKEFYVCDFKGHCVVVFSEEGAFLRRIGCESITNFPNGIDVSDAGDVLIGDSHGNKFHVAVFSREGVLTTEFECPYVKVSRCCGLKITSEGYIVTLAKNNHHVLVLNTLYIV